MAVATEDLTGIEFIKTCCPLLSSYGVQMLRFEYDGSGDSGDMHSMLAMVTPSPDDAGRVLQVSTLPDQSLIEQYTRPKNVSWETFIQQRANEKNPVITAAMCERITDEMFSLLPSGWEINDGSYGVVTLNIATGQIAIEHNERYTEVRTENFTY